MEELLKRIERLETEIIAMKLEIRFINQRLSGKKPNMAEEISKVIFESDEEINNSI